MLSGWMDLEPQKSGRCKTVCPYDTPELDGGDQLRLNRELNVEVPSLMKPAGVNKERIVVYQRLALLGACTPESRRENQRAYQSQRMSSLCTLY